MTDENTCCFKVSSRYSVQLWYPQGQSKISSEGSSSEIEKGGAIFLYTTHRLNHIHIVIKFHPSDSVRLATYCMHNVSLKTLKGSNSETKEKEQRAIFFFFFFFFFYYYFFFFFST